MRLAARGVCVLVIGAGLACGRHPLAPGGSLDAGAPPGIDAAADLPAAPDGADAPAAVDAAPSGPLPCAALRALSDRGPFTPRHAHKLLFARDRRLLVVQAAAEDPPAGSSAPDDLLIVPLPSGQPQTLVAGVRDAEWLANTGRLLVTLADGDLVVATVDGAPPRTIARRTCAHLPVPDGARVFVLRDCTSGATVGVLDEVDVATGTATPRAALASNQWAVSPSGRYAAYVANAEPDAGAPTGGAGVLHVLDGDRDQALAKVPARAPAFLSDREMLFVGLTDSGLGDAYIHFPGSGGASLRIAQNRDFGFHGYRLSPDRSMVLAAVWPALQQPPSNNTLFALRLDGRGEQTLADDLIPYNQFSLGITPFGFSADGGWVVFMPNPYQMATVHAVPAAGGQRHLLANGSAFAVSPFGDRVAVVASNASHDQYTIHFVAAATGTEAFSLVSASALSGLRFVPADRGFLFVELMGASAGRLNHFSFVDGRTTPLGSWNRTLLPIGDTPSGAVIAGYPVDPTGCFTVVDSDLAASPGTALVVLPDAPE